MLFRSEAAGIALDPAGNVHLAGTTSSFPSDPPGRPEYPRTADAIQPLYGGGASDAFVTVLGPSGTMSYSTFLGGSGDDQAKAIALGPAGGAYVAGFTNSPNFPLAQPLQAALGGGYDAWVARMNADKSALVYSSYLGGSADDRGQSLATDAAGNAYVAGTTSSSDFPTVSPMSWRPSGVGPPTPSCRSSPPTARSSSTAPTSAEAARTRVAASRWMAPPGPT